MSILSSKTRRLSAWLMAIPLALIASASLAEDSLRHLTSENCASCHADIYKQWQKSMHANSTALKDPIHGAFYRKVVGDPLHEDVRMKNGKYPVCLQCHVPAAAKDGKTKLDANPAYAEGINCVGCHTMTKFKGVDKPGGKLQLGMLAYEYSDTHLQGPSGANYSPEPNGDKKFHPYPMQGNQELMGTTAACMGCHDRRNNAKGTPLCATGDEIIKAGFEGACTDCHMPKVNGLADHTMLAGHGDGSMLAKGMVLSLNSEKAGDALNVKVNLENVLPHSFPTGAPFRNLVVKVAAYGADGKVVWQNFKTNPVKEDPQAMLKLTLGDAEGKPTAPPTATQILGDTRLGPKETRVLSYEIPAEGVSMVRAEALYNLLWPNLVTMLDKKGVLTPELKESKSVAVAEVKI